MKQTDRKINIITLGCSKNTVDSEYLIAQLTGSNFEVVHDSGDTTAKTVIINTCGFIADAKEESVNTILNFARAKQDGVIERLFVFGCLSERYKPELQKEIPEVDEFFGVKNLHDVVRAVGGDYRNNLVGERVTTTPAHYAYLKISEGCDRRCSFCAIPLIRGKHVSVPMETLLAQARSLAQRGVRELLIIAQDSTYYGLDLYGKRRLAELLERLSEIDGIEWLRLHYAYPAAFPDDLLKVVNDNPKICRYLDIPFQHVNDKVLENMRRSITGDETRLLVERIRNAVPEIALRTTLLVGHPGETDRAFDELRRFVEYARFERLGVFPYSEEDGTYSATNFRDRISAKEKTARAGEIMSLQNRIVAEINESLVGKQMRVIVDSVEDEFIVARTEYDSPEIDQEVLICKPDDGDLPTAGAFVEVEITAAEDYDLFAKIINRR